MILTKMKSKSLLACMFIVGICYSTKAQTSVTVWQSYYEQCKGISVEFNFYNEGCEDCTFVRWEASGNGQITYPYDPNYTEVTWFESGNQTVRALYREPLLNGSVISKDVYVYVHADPSLTITGPEIVCSGSTQQYSLQGGSGYYAWYASGGTISGASNTSTVNVNWTAASGTITVDYSYGYSCLSSATLSVSTGGAPSSAGVIINSGSRYSCPGRASGAITATDASVPSGFDYQYQWEESLTTAAGSWQAISGATESSYSPPAFNGEKYFRRRVTVCNNIATALYTDVQYINMTEPTQYVDLSSGGCPSSNSAINLYAYFEKGYGMGAGNYTFNWYAAPGDATPIRSVIKSEDVSVVNDVFYPAVAHEDYYLSIRLPVAYGGCETTRKQIVPGEVDTTPPVVPVIWRCNGENVFHIKLLQGASSQLLKNGVQQTASNGIYTFPASDHAASFQAMASNGGCSSTWTNLFVYGPDVMEPGLNFNDIRRVDVSFPSINNTPFCLNPVPTAITIYAPDPPDPTWTTSKLTWYYPGGNGTKTHELVMSESLNYYPQGYESQLYIITQTGAECTTPRTPVVPVGVPPLSSAGVINGPNIKWICPGTSPGQITASAPGGGLDYQYQWQEMISENNWRDIPGETGASLRLEQFPATNFIDEKSRPAVIRRLYDIPILSALMQSTPRLMFQHL